MTGVYSITNTKNHHIYIGESFDIERRWSKHKQDLEHGTHHNYLLQRDYDAYKEDAFIYRVLQEINRDEEHNTNLRIQALLLMLEDAYIKKYKENGYILYNIEDTLNNLLLGKRDFDIQDDFSIKILCSYYIKYKYIFNTKDNLFHLEKRNLLFNLIHENCSLTSKSRLKGIQEFVINDLKEKDLYDSFIIDKIQCSYTGENKTIILTQYELNNEGITYILNNYNFETFRKNKKSATEKKYTFKRLKKILIENNIVHGKTAYRDMKKILRQEQYISTDATGTGYPIPLDKAAQNGYIHIDKYIKKYDRYSFYITQKGVDHLIDKYK